MGENRDVFKDCWEKEKRFEARKSPFHYPRLGRMAESHAKQASQAVGESGRWSPGGIGAETGKISSGRCSREESLRMGTLEMLDITGHRRPEENLTFLSEIFEDFTSCSTEDEIVQAVGSRLGTYLNISSCYLVAIDEEHDTATINYTWGTGEQPHVTGAHRLSTIVNEEYRRAVRAGEAIVCNKRADTCIEVASYVKFNNQAFIDVPFHQAGKWKYLFTVTDSAARDWRKDEIELIRIVAKRMFPCLRRARTEAELRENEERYRTLAAQLQEADGRKDEFIGILSHEIRNPLAAIKMCLYLLDNERAGGKKLKMVKEIMDRQVVQLSRLIDDLLDVTRISRNKIALQKKRVELSELIQKILTDYTERFQEKAVILAAELFPDQMYVDADEARLTQIVGNLLHNAMKFTAKGGVVRVILGREEQNAVIQVKDNGEGMTPEVLATLFTPFVQADQSIYRGEDSGLGLGLVLVKGLTEMHSGAVTAYSDGPGKGSVFTVHLPLACEPASSAKQEAPATITCCRRRILIVEDIRDVAQSLKSLLESEGHEVRVAYKGADSIAVAREFRPEILLCDIGLPDMDGYQVARVFSMDEKLKDVYLVSVTGYARSQDLERARKAGFHLHIAKPVDLSKLRKALSAVN